MSSAANRRPVDRQPACTHVTMTRAFGAYRCYICHRSPSIGWVYTCTQDYDTNLQGDPLEDAMDEDPELRANSKYARDLHTIGLSDWIIRDIMKGYYLPDQVGFLIAQKLNLRDKIAAAEAAAMVEEYTRPTPRLSLLVSTDGGSPQHMSFPIVSDNLDSNTSSHHMRPRPVPRCNWKCCQNCRPTFRERTYLSFDAVFRGQIQRLPKTRPYRPPISDVNIVRRLGLRQASSYFRQISSMELTSSDDESTNGVSVGHASHISHLPDTNTSENEDKEEVEVRKSWRASMKKAWKGMLPGPRIRSDSSSVSIDVGLGDKLTTYDADAAEFDIGLWKEMSQAILDEATKIKLPGGSDEQDSEDEHEFGAGEVEVDGGVAVMEESVENRDADIIMQV